MLHAEERDYRTAASYFFECYEGVSGERGALGGGVGCGSARACRRQATRAPPLLLEPSPRRHCGYFHRPTLLTPLPLPARPTQLTSMGADAGAALSPLKHLILCAIMQGKYEDAAGIINGKAGVKHAGRGVEAMRAVAAAAKARSLLAFERAVASYADELAGDAFIGAHLSHLSGLLLESNLQRLLEPFSTVEVDHVAELIGLPPARVEATLSQVRARGRPGGRAHGRACSGRGGVQRSRGGDAAVGGRGVFVPPPLRARLRHTTPLCAPASSLRSFPRAPTPPLPRTPQPTTTTR